MLACWAAVDLPAASCRPYFSVAQTSEFVLHVIFSVMCMFACLPAVDLLAASYSQFSAAETRESVLRIITSGHLRLAATCLPSSCSSARLPARQLSLNQQRTPAICSNAFM
jgi:hypothetical protein